MTRTITGALLVLQAAVSQAQGSYQVTVVGANNRAQLRAVKAGPTEGALWGVQIVLPGALASFELISRVVIWPATTGLVPTSGLVGSLPRRNRVSKRGGVWKGVVWLIEADHMKMRRDPSHFK